MDVDVLLLGASFAGVELWHRLRKTRIGRALSIGVIDRQERHAYIPLVHEILCERLGEGATLPTRAWMAADPKLEWRTDEVVGFDPATREVRLASGGRARGRYVVIALGSTVAPPERVPGREHLQGCKLDDENTRSRQALERALVGREDTPHLVVIGGGISGVELAGDLARLREERPAGWCAPRVTLIHAGDRLLPHLGRRASRLASAALTRQGVTVRLSTRLARAEERALVLDGGERVGSDVTFWAGGLRAPAVLRQLGLPTTDDGWLAVAPTLQCDPRAAPNVFACGDDCRVVEDGRRWPTMQRAIECIWQASTVCANLLALERSSRLRRHPLREDFFHGVSIGSASLITLGAFAVDLGGFAVWFRRFLMDRYFDRYRPSARRLPPARPALPLERDAAE
ncbi:MAG: FAD-dependent oxidoreductase [Myxococcota bacterium]|nr:FAD-dependent oxidoreductase [Myxococcota bacterium]